MCSSALNSALHLFLDGETTAMETGHPAAAVEAGPSTVNCPKAPIYAFDAAPECVTSWKCREVDSEVPANFYRSARW